MPTASWASDAAGLTWLVLGTLAFIAATMAMILFHNEIRDAIKRMSNLRIKRKDTEIGAELTSPGQGDDEVEQSAESIDEEKEPESAHLDPGATEVVDESEDPSVVRSAMFRSYTEGDEIGGDKQFDRLRSLENDPPEIKRDEIRRHAGRYMGGIDPNSLDKLRAFDNDAEVSSFSHQMAGQCLRHREKCRVCKRVREGDRESKNPRRTRGCRSRAEHQLG